MSDVWTIHWMRGWCPVCWMVWDYYYGNVPVIWHGRCLWKSLNMSMMSAALTFRYVTAGKLTFTEKRLSFLAYLVATASSWKAHVGWHGRVDFFRTEKNNIEFLCLSNFTLFYFYLHLFFQQICWQDSGFKITSFVFCFASVCQVSVIAVLY